MERSGFRVLFPFFFFSLFHLLLIVSSYDIIKDIVDRMYRNGGTGT